MTNSEITAAASRLGIRAPVGSHVWEAWRDLVEQAWVQSGEADFFRNEGQHSMAAQVDLQMKATIREANTYAV